MGGLLGLHRTGVQPLLGQNFLISSLLRTWHCIPRNGCVSHHWVCCFVTCMKFTNRGQISNQVEKRWHQLKLNTPMRYNSINLTLEIGINYETIERLKTRFEPQEWLKSVRSWSVSRLKGEFVPLHAGSKNANLEKIIVCEWEHFPGEFGTETLRI